MVDNFRLTVDSNTEIEPLDSVRDVKMRGVSVTENRVANIPQMTGATANANGSAGVVPEPSVSDRDKYLKGDGTWASVQASGSNVQWDQITEEGTHIADITIDNVTTPIYAPEGGGTVTDVVDGDGTSLVDENGVAHVLGEITDVVDKNNFSLVNNHVAKMPFGVNSTICSPIPDYDNITDIDESRNWYGASEYTWTAPCDCLLVPVINNDIDFVEYDIGDFVLYSAWDNDSNINVQDFPLSYELIPLAEGTEITIKYLHRSNTGNNVRYRYIPFKRLQTNRESYPQPYLDYASIRTVSASDATSGYTAPTDGVFIAAYANSGSSNRPVICYINEDYYKYYYMALGKTPGSSMRLGEGDTVRLDSSNISGSGWFIPFATTTNPNEVYKPIPDYSDPTEYDETTLPTNIPRGVLFNDNRHTTETTTSLLTTTLVLNTATTSLTLQTISPVPTYETTRYSAVSWFSMSGTETFNGYYPSEVSGETMEGSFILFPYVTQTVSVETSYNVNDVVGADGESLVDANGIAHVNANVADVMYDDESVVDENGIAKMYTPVKATTLPTLNYSGRSALPSTSTWRDTTTVHKWTASCDCVVYAYDQTGSYNTFVKYGINNFIYYGTVISSNNNIPSGLLSNMIPIKKGQEISIQFQGQAINNMFDKVFYIPYNTIDTSAEDFPLPYLDHSLKTEIPSATTEFTATTDGIVIDNSNAKNTFVINDVITLYGKGGNGQYFDCSIPVSAGDVITLGNHSGKSFIPFKRTDNINKLISPIPDYNNRTVYTGDTLPNKFNTPGMLFLCAHDYDRNYSTTMSAQYNINGYTAYISSSNYSVNSTFYWKDGFLPLTENANKTYNSPTATGVSFFFIPYSEFDTVYVKDVLVGGNSVVGDGSIARIDSLVTDVQLNGESLVENGVAHVTGKVSDVQLDGISILDDNAVANIKSPIAIIPSPVLDYDRAAYIDESNTWNDRNEHTWVAPCDCVIYACSPNSNAATFTVDGFSYGVYKNAYGTYNNYKYNCFNSMFPVAEGSTVTIKFTGAIDTQTTYKKIAYIPFKKATTLQSVFSLPYLNYNGKEAIDWVDPLSDNDLICRYTAEVDGYIDINLILSNAVIPTISYTVNNSSIVDIMSLGRTETDMANGLILGKGDTVEIYDKGSASSYEYTGNIYFIPFATTSSIQQIVSPIPDYSSAEIMDVADFPTTYEPGYIFNCRTREGDNLQKDCIITLSDSVTLYTRAMPSVVMNQHSHFPISGNETFVSIVDETNAGNVYYVPYSEAEIVPVLVSDVKVNGSSVVDENGVANITGAGGSTVTVTQILSSGTKIAEIDVDGTTTDLYAPNGGGGGGSTVSITRKVLSGENFADITIDGTTTQLYATNTTYSNFVGATSQDAGAAGLVPAPTTSDVDKYLKGDGTWATVSGGGGGSTVTITPSLVSGIKVADYSIDSTSGSLYAPINADDMTLSAYNALTTAQKNDGTVRFIPEVKQTAYDMSNITEFNGATMTNTSTSNSTTVAWNGSTTASITDVFYYTTPIDVTSYSSITYDLITTTSYKTSAQYYIHVALSRNAPTSSNFDPSQALVDKYYNTRDNEYLNETIDVSSLTGELYLVVVASGWNLTIGNITLVPSSVNASQIKYMSETYALVEDMTGATASADGTNGLVPMPSAGDNTKYLRGDGTWKTPTNTTYSDFTGATSGTGGSHGLVPAPSSGDETKYLKGDGTWGTVSSGGSTVSVTQVQSTGTKIATITVDNVDTDLYAPSGGGGVIRENILSYIDRTLISDRYATGSLSNNNFTFSMSEDASDWSTNATAYNDTAIDSFSAHSMSPPLHIISN